MSRLSIVAFSLALLVFMQCTGQAFQHPRAHIVVDDDRARGILQLKWREEILILDRIATDEPDRARDVRDRQDFLRKQIDQLKDNPRVGDYLANDRTLSLAASEIDEARRLEALGASIAVLTRKDVQEAERSATAEISVAVSADNWIGTQQDIERAAKKLAIISVVVSGFDSSKAHILKQFVGVPTIVEVAIVKSRVTFQDLAHLAAFQRLRTLTMPRDTLTLNDLEWLAGRVKLEDHLILMRDESLERFTDEELNKLRGHFGGIFVGELLHSSVADPMEP